MPICRCSNRRRAAALQGCAGKIPWLRRANVVVGSESKSGNAAEFIWRHDDVFRRIASRYDLLCDVFSLGIHRLWKRSVARRIASEEWSTVLDGATGTGDIILRVLAQEMPEGRRIIASDVSTKMLAIAQQRLARHAGRVQLR